jgi:hypothetical protein
MTHGIRLSITTANIVALCMTYSITALNIIVHSKMTLSITTFSIMTLSIMTPNIMKLGIMTFSIMALSMIKNSTTKLNIIKCNGLFETYMIVVIMQSVVTLGVAIVRW